MLIRAQYGVAHPQKTPCQAILTRGLGGAAWVWFPFMRRSPAETVWRFELDVAADAPFFNHRIRELRVLGGLNALEVVVARRIAEVVGTCREQGVSWSEIAAILHVSKQAAHERFGHRKTRPATSAGGPARVGTAPHRLGRTLVLASRRMGPDVGVSFGTVSTVAHNQRGPDHLAAPRLRRRTPAPTHPGDEHQAAATALTLLRRAQPRWARVRVGHRDGEYLAA